MKTRSFTFIVFLIVTLLVYSGCDATSQPTGDRIKVTDLLGREVSVPASVERVVAIGPGALRLYVYAGNVDDVVGVEQIEVNRSTGRPYLLANPGLAELPVIGQGGPSNAPDPEKILTVEPDVIFSTYTSEASAADELQAKTGIPVVMISYGGWGMGEIFGEDVQDSLRLIGDVIGQDDKAQAVVKFIQQVEQDLESRTENIPDADKPSVYVGGLGARGAHGIESTQGQYPLLDVIHARNVVDETGESGSIMIDKEMLLSWDPEYIFIDQGGFASVLEDYQKNPSLYEALSAVRDGRLYSQLPYNYYNTNIDTALADAYYLGKVLFPDAFADVDPVQKADEIYVRLVGTAVYGQMTDDFGGFGPLTLSEK